MVISFADFFDHISRTRLKTWLPEFQQAINYALGEKRHGDLDRWLAALDALPAIAVSDIKLNTDTLLAGVAADIDAATRSELQQALQQLHPWRKGPFSIAGLHIDTEWRSDWKWQRLAPHIADLKHRKVLDIGCGSGYHLWRMLGAGAGMAIGIEPSQLFLCQFHAVKKYLGAQPAYLLPFGIEQLPAKMAAFDTVFSMGVLYHRRSPLDHLIELRELLVPGGELVLETLVINPESQQPLAVGSGAAGYSLVPTGRYARMGNVWFLPTPATLIHWLEKCGFVNIRTVDINTTSCEEQRATDWMRFQSLADFLDPDDASKTIEGYPAPVRAIVIANAKT